MQHKIGWEEVVVGSCSSTEATSILTADVTGPFADLDLSCSSPRESAFIAWLNRCEQPCTGAATIKCAAQPCDLPAYFAAASDGGPCSSATSVASIVKRDDSAFAATPRGGAKAAGLPAALLHLPSDPHSFEWEMRATGARAGPAAAAAKNGASSGGPAASFGGGARSFALSTGPIAGLRLGPLLGRGSYGHVYRGVYRGEAAAVKVVDNSHVLARDADGEPLEVSLARGLSHPNVMGALACGYGDATYCGPSRAAFSSGSSQPVCWMVFELCDMGTLAAAVDKGWFKEGSDPSGPADLRQVAGTAREICDGMAYLHGRGVLHGDLCGKNVMLQSTGADGGDADSTGSTISAISTRPPTFRAKVGDFGLSRRLVPPSQCLMVIGDSYGTVTHAAPEVMENRDATQASDVYSFGVMLHEMITGRRAWAGLSQSAVVVQVSLLRRGLEVPAGLPAALDSLLQACLSRDPSARPTFAEAAQQLSAWLDEQPEPRPPAAEPATGSRAPLGGRWARLWGAVSARAARGASGGKASKSKASHANECHLP